jgi:hypothetical protein
LFERKALVKRRIQRRCSYLHIKKYLMCHFLYLFFFFSRFPPLLLRIQRSVQRVGAEMDVMSTRILKFGFKESFQTDEKGSNMKLKVSKEEDDLEGG